MASSLKMGSALQIYQKEKSVNIFNVSHAT
jgi:hypothetical protein